MSVAVIDANESPYDMEKETERNRDCKPCTPQGWRRVIAETLYVLPVLPKECENTERKGRERTKTGLDNSLHSKTLPNIGMVMTCKGKSVEVG